MISMARDAGADSTTCVIVRADSGGGSICGALCSVSSNLEGRSRPAFSSIVGRGGESSLGIDSEDIWANGTAGLVWR